MTKQFGAYSEMEYEDFVIEIKKGQGREYPVEVVESPAGETEGLLTFPFDELVLQNALKDLEIALLRYGAPRRQAFVPEQESVQTFGKKLFEALMVGDIRSAYDVSYNEAAQNGKGLRVKLRVNAPELAALPWEYLFDSRRGEYLCMSRSTPVVRYLELQQTMQPLAVAPPLRILGMVSKDPNLPELETAREVERMNMALAPLAGRVEITWLEGETWRELSRAMLGGPWHIFHFIGHGGFDPQADEGYLALPGEDGQSQKLYATSLGRLLADHRSLRLAFLNSCEGARGSEMDVFSSTASILVRRGLPAVVAMQFAITDRAAIEFSRTFYEALAMGLPVDGAVWFARNAVSMEQVNTIEWGVPVLFMRAENGKLFEFTGPPETPPAEASARPVEAAVTQPQPATLVISSEIQVGEPGQPAQASQTGGGAAQAAALPGEAARSQGIGGRLAQTLRQMPRPLLYGLGAALVLILAVLIWGLANRGGDQPPSTPVANLALTGTASAQNLATQAIIVPPLDGSPSPSAETARIIATTEPPPAGDTPTPQEEPSPTFTEPAEDTPSPSDTPTLAPSHTPTLAPSDTPTKPPAGATLTPTGLPGAGVSLLPGLLNPCLGSPPWSFISEPVVRIPLTSRGCWNLSRFGFSALPPNIIEIETTAASGVTESGLMVALPAGQTKVLFLLDLHSLGPAPAYLAFGLVPADTRGAPTQDLIYVQKETELRQTTFSLKLSPEKDTGAYVLQNGRPVTLDPRLIHRLSFEIKGDDLWVYLNRKVVDAPLPAPQGDLAFWIGLYMPNKDVMVGRLDFNTR